MMNEVVLLRIPRQLAIRDLMGVARDERRNPSAEPPASTIPQAGRSEANVYLLSSFLGSSASRVATNSNLG